MVQGWESESSDPSLSLAGTCKQLTLIARYTSVCLTAKAEMTHPRTRLVYFYLLRVKFLVKTWTCGRRDQVRLPWQRYICRSKYGCFRLSPQVTYLHTKNEGGLKFLISNFASLSRRIALKQPMSSSLGTDFVFDGATKDMIRTGTHL